jgi:hypothetical protein
MPQICLLVNGSISRKERKEDSKNAKTHHCAAATPVSAKIALKTQKPVTIEVTGFFPVSGKSNRP